MSKQVRRAGSSPPVTTPPSPPPGSSPPVTTPPAPPPASNYNAFLAYEVNNGSSQPTEIVPKSVTLTLTKVFSYNISNAVSLSYVKNMFI